MATSLKRERRDCGPRTIHQEQRPPMNRRLLRKMLWSIALFGLPLSVAGAQPMGSGVQKHWAFEPIKKVEPPDDPSCGSVSRIDRFVRAKQLPRDPAPAGPAERRAAVRHTRHD